MKNEQINKKYDFTPYKSKQLSFYWCLFPILLEVIYTNGWASNAGKKNDEGKIKNGIIIFVLLGNGICSRLINTEFLMNYSYQYKKGYNIGSYNCLFPTH